MMVLIWLFVGAISCFIAGYFGSDKWLLIVAAIWFVLWFPMAWHHVRSVR